MIPTYQELQQRIAELEQALANRREEQIKISSFEEQSRVFEAVISQSPSAILITDEQGIIRYANDAYFQTLGYAPELMKEEFMLSILQDDESLVKYEELKASIKNGDIWRGELRTARKDGQAIWVRLVTFPIIHQGQVKNYVVIFNDNTRLRDIEAARQNQDAIYKALVENMPLAIIIFDENGKILFVNENTEKLFNLEKGSMLGKTVHQVFPAETADDQVKLIRQVYETGKPVNTDRNMVWQGKMMNFKVTRQPLFNEKKQVISVLGIAQNITERKRQQKLLNIQRHIDSISNVSNDLKSSLDIVFQYLLKVEWIDCGGVYILNENKDAFELTYSEGLSEKFVGLVSYVPMSDIFTRYLLTKIPLYISEPDFAEQIKQDMIDEGLKAEAVIPLVYQDEVIGSLNLGSRSAKKIDEFDKKIVESIAYRLANLIMLVKTRMQLDRSNNELNNKLQELNIKQQLLIQKSRLESLGELSAGLAHEINQPLSVVSLAMENIQYKLGKKAASEEYLLGKIQTINNNINKIRELIDHVRIFSRDQGTILYEQVDVNLVIRNALSMIESQLRSRNIKVVTDLSTDLGFTVGNPSRFEQVILNLLSNSRDALGEKDSKSSLDNMSKEIRIKTFSENNRIFMQVWDNGSGISEKNLDKIFNPFFTTKSEGLGTGLGLPIVYGIIGEMNGEINVRTDDGKFTEISIDLPQYENKVEKI
jgi:PAS domain S-box-containing protein